MKWMGRGMKNKHLPGDIFPGESLTVMIGGTLLEDGSVEDDDDIMVSQLEDYIASLSQKEQIYPEDLLDKIEVELQSLNERSGAHITRSRPDTLVFIGSQEQILKALSLIEETSSIANMHDLGTNLSSLEVMSPLHSGDGPLRLPTAVSEFEDTLMTLPETKYPRQIDYTRTTLLGGPPRYTTKEDKPVVRHTVVDKSDSAADLSKHSEIYTHMVKLGYKRDQVQAALDKFGASATMNTVLDYLLKQADSSDPRISSLDPEEEETLSALAAIDEIDENASSNLKPIMIDGSNIAMSCGRNSQFDCHGIKVAVDYFVERGHTKVIAFVPQFRKEKNKAEPTIGQEILPELEERGNLVFTPSRRIGTKRVVSYDDRYILDAALKLEGIVVSNDHFRDFLEDEKYRKLIETQLLMYTFVHGIFMPCQDPLGKHGPTLDDFLKKRTKQKQLQRCPYGVKCTFGAQCKYYHPERKVGARTVSQKLKDIAQENLKDRSDGVRYNRTEPLPGHSPQTYPSSRLQERPNEPSEPDMKAVTSPLPGSLYGASGGGQATASGGHYPYTYNYHQHPGYGPPGGPLPEDLSEMEKMRRDFEWFQIEKSRLSNIPQQRYSSHSNQSSPRGSAQLLGYPSSTAYQGPATNSPAGRGSPYSSPNATGMLTNQDSVYPGSRVDHYALRGALMDPSLQHQRGPMMDQSLDPGMFAATTPFLPPKQRYATSSGTLLPGSSRAPLPGGSGSPLPAGPVSTSSPGYHQQYHHFNQTPTGSGGRVSSAGSNPLGYPVTQEIKRSQSLQEGENSLQQTRQNIFNNLSRLYGSDLVRHVMNSNPRETDVNKILCQLSKLQSSMQHYK